MDTNKLIQWLLIDEEDDGDIYLNILADQQPKMGPNPLFITRKSEGRHQIHYSWTR